MSGSGAPPASPSVLTPRPARFMVRRIGFLPLIGLGAVGLSILGVVVYTGKHKAEQNEATLKQEAAEIKIHGGKSPDFLNTPPVENLPLAKPDVETPPAPATTPKLPDLPKVNEPAANPPDDVYEQARKQAWTAYFAAQAQQVAAHNALELQALSGGNHGTHANGNSDIPDVAPPSNSGGLSSVLPPELGGNTGISTGGVNPAGQSGKQAFLKNAGDIFGLSENVEGSVHGPKPSTVMATTAMSCVILEGATSDMAGSMVAEINTNIYDSMTGDVLLIPHGTRIQTTYDIAISSGQDRLGVIAQRLIFPDTSSRQIGSMSVSDPAGLAGLKDLLNTHFWEKFGSALTVAFVGAGVQLSQPQQSAFATPSSTSAATGAMTQQLASFGQEQARANSFIPNTIELRPGLPCMIKLDKDLALPEWHDARLQTTSGSGSLTVGKRIQ